MTEPELPIKKSVSLAWQEKVLAFDVAQDLFSSHQVDRGSRMLLDSLDIAAFGDTGHAVDFGCGYGVLGIAWQTVRPRWITNYVDRDALAVAFTRHNLSKTGVAQYGQARLTCDISIPFEEAGYDLVLWNVPGKAGREVVAGLLDVAVDSMATGGVLAVVVVHPLADLFTDGLARDDVTVALSKRGKEHTVVHIRRDRGRPVQRAPFDDGLFDRPARTFSTGNLTWELTPVIGLPEYDSLNHATELAINSLISVRGESSVGHWIEVDPGVGHLALVTSRLWANASGGVYGRDALAVRATRRALGRDISMETGVIWGLGELSPEQTADLVVLALPEQAQSDELAELLGTAWTLVCVGGVVVFHGRSTEVARIERLIRRESGWKARKPVKSRGSACVTVRRGAP